MLTNALGAKLAVIADVQAFSAAGGSVTCTLMLDTTQLDTSTIAVPANGFEEVVLQGVGTAGTSGGSGVVTLNCSGAGTFSQYHVQALEVQAP